MRYYNMIVKKYNLYENGGLHLQINDNLKEQTYGLCSYTLLIIYVI